MGGGRVITWRLVGRAAEIVPSMAVP